MRAGPIFPLGNNYWFARRLPAVVVTLGPIRFGAFRSETPMKGMSAMGEPEAAGQQPSADPDEKDTGTEAAPDAAEQAGELKPETKKQPPPTPPPTSTGPIYKP